jgi:hypothetical protein
MYQPRQGVYWHRESFNDQFDCQLPAEARIELLEEILPPTIYPIREEPRAYQPPPPPQPQVISPPAIPLRPVVAAGAGKPAESASRSDGIAIWLLLGFLGIVVFIAMLAHAISSVSAPSSRPVYGAQPSQPAFPPVAVRRALPVEVRRAELVSPKLITENPPTPAPYAEWHQVTLLDGRTTVPACYQGELPNSAALPHQGRFIGEEWSTGNTSWIWMTPAGASFSSWVDP